MRVIKLLLTLFILVVNNHNTYCFRISPTTEKKFQKAFHHYDTDNQKLDTSICKTIKAVVQKTVETNLQDWETEWLSNGDFLITSIGQYNMSKDYFAKIMWANEEQAYLLDSEFNLKENRILGSMMSCFSRDGYYAGNSGFDCDEHVLIYIYHSGEGAELQLIATYENWDMRIDNLSNNEIPALFWYNGNLYCRFVKM